LDFLGAIGSKPGGFELTDEIGKARRGGYRFEKCIHVFRNWNVGHND
jgi:hypothetical protein